MGARLERVNEQVKEVLAELLARLEDPRIGFVTLTGVDTSPDLSRATIWFTVLGDDADDEVLARTEAGLASAAPHLRRELGRQVRMERIPDLHFRPDPAPAHGRRVEGLLAEQRRDDEEG